MSLSSRGKTEGVTPEIKDGFVVEGNFDSAEEDNGNKTEGNKRTTSGRRKHRHHGSSKGSHKLRAESAAAATVAKLTSDLTVAHEVLAEKDEDLAAKDRQLAKEESDRKKLAAQALGELVVTKSSLKKTAETAAELEKRLQKEKERAAKLHQADKKDSKRKDAAIADLEDEVEGVKSEKSQRQKIYEKHIAELSSELDRDASLLEDQTKRNKQLESQLAEATASKDQLSAELQQKQKELARLDHNVKAYEAFHHKTRLQRVMEAFSTGGKITVVSALVGIVTGFVMLYTDWYAMIPVLSPALLTSLGVVGTLTAFAGIGFALSASLLIAGAVISAKREKKIVLQEENKAEAAVTQQSTATMQKALANEPKMEQAEKIKIVLVDAPKKSTPPMFSLAYLKSIFWNMEAKKQAAQDDIIVKNAAHPAPSAVKVH